MDSHSLPARRRSLRDETGAALRIGLPRLSRIHLRPQETTRVAFQVPQKQIAVWTAENKRSLESGKYAIWVDGSSFARLTTQFVLAPRPFYKHFDTYR
ncbi:MAG: fibronectin type III-like domain-contianing protein [Terracidiphilus sp.]